jgi:hypothetical protein
VGLGIASDAARAVIVRGASIVWSSEAVRDDGEPLSAAIQRVLAKAPVRRWPRLRVNVAIGPTMAQTKHLTGLPPIDDARTLARMVAEGSSRFFLRNGAPLVTTAVRVTKAGEAWACALDSHAVEEVARACRLARMRLGRVAPTVAVLSTVLDGERIAWADGAASSEISFDKGLLKSVRRASRDEGVDAQSMRPVAPLTMLGEHGWRFADAYGAAMLSAHEPLALDGAGAVLGGASVPRWRLTLAAAALFMMLTAALAAPTIASTMAAERARRQLSAIDAQRRAAMLLESELATTTAALAELSALAASRRSFTMMLAELTRVLPTESAIVAFRADSTSGSIVALAARGGAVLSALEEAEGLVTPEIFGPVTREIVAGRELERVTIRFRLDAGRGTRDAGREPRRSTASARGQ